MLKIKKNEIQQTELTNRRSIERSNDRMKERAMQ